MLGGAQRHARCTLGPHGTDRALQGVELGLGLRLRHGPSGVQVLVVQHELGDPHGGDSHGGDGLAVEVQLLHRERALEPLALLGQVLAVLHEGPQQLLRGQLRELVGLTVALVPRRVDGLGLPRGGPVHQVHEGTGVGREVGDHVGAVPLLAVGRAAQLLGREVLRGSQEGVPLAEQAVEDGGQTCGVSHAGQSRWRGREPHGCPGAVHTGPPPGRPSRQGHGTTRPGPPPGARTGPRESAVLRTRGGPSAAAARGAHAAPRARAPGRPRAVAWCIPAPGGAARPLASPAPRCARAA